MADYTNFPAAHPFYGGRAKRAGTGIHEDEDPITKEKEYLVADTLNRIELRIQQLERTFNQLEHEILYPGGRISTSGSVTLQVPSSGNWYLSSRIDLMASGVNVLVQKLAASGSLVSGDIPGYPFWVGDL